MADTYCSVRFKTGEELDAALTAALSACDEAKKACDAADRAEKCSSHPPIIGDNGNWLLWDGEKYVDSGHPSQGEQGQGVKVAKIGEVTLLASNWVGEDNLYSQAVSIDGVTENSQVDLTPNVQQLAVFYNKDISFVTENDEGVVTVYAIGQKPLNDYTIQVTITEVDL